MLEKEYNIIRKKRPFGAGPNTQTVRYEIMDNFFRFWFRYVQHYSYLLEIQNYPALQEILDILAFSLVREPFSGQ